MFSFLARLALAATMTLGLVLAGVGPASAAPASDADADAVGVDVSWPQCGKSLPQRLSFAIVGVNNGLANTTNPCLAEQLAWARTATEAAAETAQPTVALYVNTANPGWRGSWWPKSNSYQGKRVSNPYGDCALRTFKACSYMYGYAKAYDDAKFRGISDPSSYLWWLDVETENSWQRDKAANVAVLEGMATYFKSIGAPVGIYSTGYQWKRIAGTVKSTSPLAGLPSWLAGARSRSGALDSCSLPALTPRSRVAMVQYVSDGLDYNVSCTLMK